MELFLALATVCAITWLLLLRNATRTQSSSDLLEGDAMQAPFVVVWHKNIHDTVSVKVAQQQLAGSSIEVDNLRLVFEAVSGGCQIPHVKSSITSADDVPWPCHALLWVEGVCEAWRANTSTWLLDQRGMVHEGVPWELAIDQVIPRNFVGEDRRFDIGLVVLMVRGKQLACAISIQVRNIYSERQAQVVVDDAEGCMFAIHVYQAHGDAGIIPEELSAKDGQTVLVWVHSGRSRPGLS